MKQHLLLAGVVVCMAALTAPAAAGTPIDEEGKGRVVFFGDLNLENPVGADTLLNRIRFTARKVCGGAESLQSIAIYRAAHACQLEATSKAVSDVGHANVTSRYYGRTPRVIIASVEPSVAPSAPADRIFMR
jgi:UrcA family protein